MLLSSVILVVTNLLIFCLLANGFQQAENGTGLQVRLTNSGFDLVSEIVKDQTFELASKLKFNATGLEDILFFHVRYMLYDFIVTNMHIGPLVLRTVPLENGIRIQLKHLSAVIIGKYKFITSVLDSKGVVQINATSVSLDTTLTVKAVKGKPQLGMKTCALHIAYFHITSFDSTFIPYDTFVNLFRSTISRKIEDAACKEMKEYLEGDVNQKIQNFAFLLDVAQMRIDYRLTKPPLFGENFLEIYHSARTYINGLKSDIPFNPAPFQTYDDTPQMATVWVAEAALNDFANAAFNTGFLNRTFTDRDLLNGLHSLPCTDLVTCLSEVVPRNLSWILPFTNLSTRFHVEATQPPQFSLTSSGVQIYAQAKTKIGISLFGAQTTSIAFGFTVDLKSVISSTNNKIGGNLKTITIKLFKTTQDFNFLSFNRMVELVMEKYGIPTLNDILKTGFSLPLPKNVLLKNTTLTTLQDTLIAATDVRYLYT